jgi:hypothetical protein
MTQSGHSPGLQLSRWRPEGPVHLHQKGNDRTVAALDFLCRPTVALNISATAASTIASDVFMCASFNAQTDLSMRRFFIVTRTRAVAFGSFGLH